MGLPGKPYRILEECRYSMLATDFLARGLSSLERANLEMDYLEALAELFPSCEAFFFSGSGKLFEAEEIRGNQIEGPDRFIRLCRKRPFLHDSGFRRHAGRYTRDEHAVPA